MAQVVQAVTADQAMLLYTLYLAGAIAAGFLLGRILGRITGLCIAFFYVVVLVMIATGSTAGAAKVPASFHKYWLEAILVSLVSMILYEFVQNCRSGENRLQALNASNADNPSSAAASNSGVAAAVRGPDAVSNTSRDQQRWHKGQAPQHAGHRRDIPQAMQQQMDHSHEVWRGLPDAVFADVLERLPSADRGSIRAVCSHWFDAGKRTVTRLHPNRLHVKELVSGFPSLKTLELSTCSKDVSPSRLRQLRHLSGLEQLLLGCHHRQVACSVTDECLPELVQLRNLRTLNLSQCIHVTDSGLMHLVHLTSLRSLNISGCVAVTDIGIMMVAQLTQLLSLDMPWCLKVTNIGLKSLAPLVKLTNLNISGCQLINEEGILGLTAFTNLEKLGLLNLGYSRVCVTDAALEQLSGLRKLHSLQLGSMQSQATMQMNNRLVTDRAVRAISSNHKQLTHLALLSVDITDDGVSHLAQLSGLQALNLRGCARITGNCLKHLTGLTGMTDLCLLQNHMLEVNDACGACLGHLPSLQVLGLGNSQVNAAASESCLVPLSNCSKLQILTLTYFTGQFSPQACRALAQMGNLQHLDLQASQHVGTPVLAAVGQLPALQSLQLVRCAQVDDTGLQHISDLATLHTLNMSMCFKVTDVGLVAITKLQGLTQLLAQQCKDVTDAGIAQLGFLSQLKVLDLSQCERITGSGFQAFGNCRQLGALSLNGCSSLNDGGLREIGKLTSLTKLELSSCPLINDAGVGRLRALGGLTGLDLGFCARVGDAAMTTIAQSMRKLSTLRVRGCIRLTDAGVQQLTSLPGLLNLDLGRCLLLSDLGLQSLTRLSGLSSLRINYCPNITDAGVMHLTRLSRLSTLSLAQCPRVTDFGLMALAPITSLATLEF